MDLLEHLAVPYLLTTYAAALHDGRWQRFAEYPEIGCVSYADTLDEAMERLEEVRVDYILGKLAAGVPVPTPRPPLQSLLAEFDDTRARDLRDRLSAISGTHGQENG